MTPVIKTSSLPFTRVEPYPSLTYKDSTNQIAGLVDGLAAMQQTVRHILSIERYAYSIYDSNYGVELARYVGKNFAYINATIRNTIRNALLQDDRIVDVKDFKVEQIGGSKCKVSFTVITKLGDFKEGLDIDI